MDDERKYGLTEKQLNDVVRIISQNTKVEKITLFGSRAMGTFHNGSDIDLALIGEDLGLTDLSEILVDLDSLYLPYAFDLIIYNRISEPALLDHINRVGIEFYKR
jgi:predicted nucleotidyltransferase